MSISVGTKLGVRVSDGIVIGPSMGVQLSGAAGNSAYSNKILASAPSFLIGYWPMSEASGSVSNDYSGQANHGAYTGVTLGQTGIGDGRTCPLFDGVNDFNNIYSAALNTDFNPSEFVIACWFRVSGAGVWTDGTTRRIVRLAADTSNLVNIVRSSTNNRLQFAYTSGGAAKSIVYDTLGGSTAWHHLAISVSKANDAMKGFVNGAQIVTTQTSLGVWAGALASTSATIGAFNTTPTNPWDGYLAHAAIWSGVGAPAAVEALLPSLATV